MYDLEFDTSVAAPMECALQIKRVLSTEARGHLRSALPQLVVEFDT
jgi:hypothetical protein